MDGDVAHFLIGAAKTAVDGSALSFDLASLRATGLDRVCVARRSDVCSKSNVFRSKLKRPARKGLVGKYERTSGLSLR